MLDAGPDAAAGDVYGHRLAPGLGPLELRDETPAVEQAQIGGRAVGGIGPHPARQVVRIEQPAELAAVMPNLNPT